MKIEVIKLNPEAIVPTYAHETDAGADLYAIKNVTIYAKEKAVIETGIAINIPQGYVGFITPRSGLALNKSLTVLNSPGTIDSGYQGEIKVILLNTDPWKEKYIKKNDRIAQIVFQKIEKAEFLLSESFNNESNRSDNGFGSTGN
jgi:dUTP pyrophosphatase